MYIKQPEGYVIPEKENKFCSLNKALYGLKQSPKCWNDILCKSIKNMGFVESNGDTSAFVRYDDLCFLGIYIDCSYYPMP